MATERKKPAIAITMGDPCGVGPEIIVKALMRQEVFDACDPVVIGDPAALERAMGLLGTNPDALRPFRIVCPKSLGPEDIRYGLPGGRTCGAVVRYIETAVRMTLDREVDGICTCPIHKAHLNAHGFAFPGHTEFLQHLTGGGDVVMMLAGPRLKVSLVTIHEALADVPRLLDTDRILRTIRITGEALLRDFGLREPRLAVAGLNPHAGEGGLFGKEEEEVIRPAIEALMASPYVVTGPYPPDTIFRRAFNGEFDAVVCMYHDQGLIPIKLVHFDNAVNITLGLPVVRTSVDHGTAYDIAGTGSASPESLLAALSLAASMAANRMTA